MSTPLTAALLLFVAGLLVGSFVNVVIHRVPLGLSVVSPRSRCPRCGAPIRWWENIPLASWIALGGRCSSCREPIALRYPMVELGHGLLWALAAWVLGPGPTLVILLPFLSAQLALFFTDWDHQLLPDRITLPVAAVGLALSPWSSALFGTPAAVERGLGRALSLLGLASAPGSPAQVVAGRVAAATLGAALGYGLFWALGTVWQLLRKEEALGGGDLKLMLGVGAFLGPGGVLLTIVLGSLSGSVVGLVLMARGGAGWKTRLPFGCFLTPAAVVAALWGRGLVETYLRLSGWAR